MAFKSKYAQFWFPPLYGLICYATLRLVVDTISNFRFWIRPWYTNAIEIIGSALIGYLFLWAIRKTEKKYDESNQASFQIRTVLQEFLMIMGYTLLIINSTIVPMAAVTDNGLQLFDVITINLIPGFYVMILFMFRRANYYLEGFIDNKLALEKANQEQLKSEMEFLKGQFHPHFLFNSLNTIYFQMDESVRDAKVSIEKLSDLLRYRLYDHGIEKVLLSDEIGYLEKYIDFQKIRKSEMLTLKFHHNENSNGARIYPFLLLPFVENAFKYVGGSMHISISVELIDHHLTYRCVNSVSDNMPSPGSDSGIGHSNLSRRLDILYPDRHRMTLNKDVEEYSAILQIDLSKNDST